MSVRIDSLITKTWFKYNECYYMVAINLIDTVNCKVFNPDKKHRILDPFYYGTVSFPKETLVEVVDGKPF